MLLFWLRVQEHLKRLVSCIILAPSSRMVKISILISWFNRIIHSPSNRHLLPLQVIPSQYLGRPHHFLTHQKLLIWRQWAKFRLWQILQRPSYQSLNMMVGRDIVNTVSELNQIELITVVNVTLVPWRWTSTYTLLFIRRLYNECLLTLSICLVTALGTDSHIKMDHWVPYR